MMEKENKEVKALAICMVLSVVLGGTASAAIVFADKVDYRTGRCPYGIYAADFDGDVDKDVVTTNRESSTFSYFTNKGDGTFSEKVDYKTGEAPQGIYAADFDGDGDMDVVTADSGGLWAGNFSYFANIGDGIFSEKVNYKTGWGPHGIHAADFDGDCDVDVVVTNSLSHTFSYFANRGDGTFLEKVDYKTGEMPKDIHAEDFDGDGDVDVVTAGRGDTMYGGAFSYFTNKGDGTFSAKEDYDIGQGTTDSIHATDFDGDGDPDIVTTISNGFSYFENYGDGTFSIGAYYKPYSGTSTSIYAADFDNDGDNDVVTTHYLFHVDGYFSCFANSGDGTFSDPVDYVTGEEPSGIYATDFDGDGDTDVVTVNSAANAFSYFENVVSVVLVSDYTTKPPEIDGIIRPGEWTNKMSITLNGYEDPKSRKEGELYVMNDDDNIYIAVVIPDANDADLDNLLLDFDQGNDHIATDGEEDAIRCSTIDQTFYYIDMHWDSA
ncbi:MAG: VCBS repeat-containing protein, partial [Euryarchaeota archaeon]|nr:VCBS repeat-containing protein [Euryarchaeota archaeon]